MDANVRTFDPHGDLHLLVGPEEERQHFVVCARSTARASKVWDRMLFGPYAESQPGKNSRDKSHNIQNTAWTVVLPEDDPAPMSSILSIIHGAFEEVPMFLATGDLFDITVLTDKYDLTARLSPWAHHWTQLLADVGSDSTLTRRLHHESDTAKEEAFSLNSIMEKEEGLWVAWELGDKALFDKLSLNLMRYATIDTEGTLMVEECKVPSVSPSPPGLFEAIKAARAVAVDSLIEIFAKPLREWSPSNPQFCEKPDEHSHCPAYMLGMILTKLGEIDINLLNGTMPFVYRDSIQDLTQKLLSLRIPDLSGRKGTYLYCDVNTKMRRQIQEAVDTIKPPTTVAHQKHLESQATKSCVDAYRPKKPQERLGNLKSWM